MNAAVYARKSSLAVLLWALTLAGCQLYWRKPGADEAAFTADHRDCVAKAGVPVSDDRVLVNLEVYRACLRVHGWQRESASGSGPGIYRGLEDEGPVAREAVPVAHSPAPPAPAPVNPAPVPTLPVPQIAAVPPPPAAPAPLHVWAPGRWRSVGGTNALVIERDLRWSWDSSAGGRWSGRGSGEIRDGQILLRGWHSTSIPMQLRLTREGETLVGELQTSRSYRMIFLREP
jgi:hypothetical protein